MKYNLKLLFGQKYIDIIHKKVNVSDEKKIIN